MYILTIEAKRKNAKRHIVDKSEDLNKLEEFAKNLNDDYIKKIYTGRWEFIKEVIK